MSTTRKLRISKKKNTDAEIRSVLKKIVTIVNRGVSDPNAKRLWDILTALRGPDSGHSYIKELTTERIRYILGFYATLFFTSSNALIYDPDLHKKIAEGEGIHFADHIAGAVQAMEDLGYLR